MSTNNYLQWLIVASCSATILTGGCATSSPDPDTQTAQPKPLEVDDSGATVGENSFAAPVCHGRFNDCGHLDPIEGLEVRLDSARLRESFAAGTADDLRFEISYTLWAGGEQPWRLLSYFIDPNTLREEGGSYVIWIGVDDLCHWMTNDASYDEYAYFDGANMRYTLLSYARPIFASIPVTLSSGWITCPAPL